MDVLCVGMYRACSTWQYEVAADLVEIHRAGSRLGYVTGDQYAALGASNGWRVLKSHEGHPAFREALGSGRAVALYSIRDPRDVVFSMLHKRQLSFSAFLRQGMIHQIVANDREWSRQPASRRITQRYEALIADPASGVEQIATFLDITILPDEVRRLASEYSLEANRRRALATAERLRADGVDLDDPANATHCDDRSLLHWNHVRRGQNGGWRDQANPGERRRLALLLNRWASENGYASDEEMTSTSWIERIGVERDLLQGAIRCALRCAALDHPRAGRIAKRTLRIDSGSTRST